MGPFTWTKGFGWLLVAVGFFTLLAVAPVPAQVVADCTGQDDGTPCNGNNGVVNLCILAGASCASGLCSGPLVVCPRLQRCDPNGGYCVTTPAERAVERRIERR